MQENAKKKKKINNFMFDLGMYCDLYMYPAFYIVYFRTKCDFLFLCPENKFGIIHNTYPRRRKCYPLQHSCLANPMDRGAWQATVHGVARVGHDLATKLLLL